MGAPLGAVLNRGRVSYFRTAARNANPVLILHLRRLRVHETIRMTPAMALGVADHSWDIGELIEAATGPEPEGRPVGRFRVIDGGRI